MILRLHALSKLPAIGGNTLPQITTQSSCIQVIILFSLRKSIPTPTLLLLRCNSSEGYAARASLACGTAGMHVVSAAAIHTRVTIAHAAVPKQLTWHRLSNEKHRTLHSRPVRGPNKRTCHPAQTAETTFSNALSLILKDHKYCLPNVQGWTEKLTT
jgi:hypothetical protein